MHEESSLIKEMNQFLKIDMHHTTRLTQILAVGITVLFMISSASTMESLVAPDLVQKSNLSVDLPTLERHWPVKIVFVGYDSNILNVTYFVDQLPASSTIEYDNLTVEHFADYNVRFASDLYYNRTMDMLRNNSQSGIDIGTELDTQALIDYRDGVTSTPDFFEPQSGTSINATEVERWFNQHPLVQDGDEGWVIYILNTTELVSELPYGLHWYEYDYQNPDSASETYWYDEFLVNPPESIQLNSFGGTYNKFILDPFADQWYLEWAKIWYNDSLPSGDTWPEYFNTTIVDKLESIDLAQESGRNQIADYFADYCRDIIQPLFIPDTVENVRYLNPFTFDEFFTLPSVTVDIYSIDRDISEYTWITNYAYLEAQMNSLLPFDDMMLSLSYNNLDDVADLNSTFWSNVSLDFGSILLNGSSFLTDTSTGDLNSIAMTIFVGDGLQLTDNGLNATYLTHGTNGVICSNYLDLIVDSTPLHGISERILQAVGDLLGLKSSLFSNSFISSYSHGLMGELTRFGQYSRFEQSGIWRTYIDPFDSYIRNQFLANLTLLPAEIPGKTQGIISDALRTLRYASHFLIAHDPLSAYDALRSMNNWTRRIFASLTDTLRPEFFAWDITRPVIINQSFVVWANISETGSGIENASVLVTRNNYEASHLMKYNGTLWVTTIPALQLNASFEVYIVAFDWALNRAESFSVTIDLRPGEPPPLDPWVTAPIVVIGTGSVLIVVLIVAIIYDKRRGS